MTVDFQNLTIPIAIAMPTPPPLPPSHTPTPTPWYVGSQNDALYIIDSPPHTKANVIASLASTELRANEDANAAHIVRCVNAHNALVSALELARDVFNTEAVKNKEAGRASAAECWLELVEEMNTALRAAKGEA